MSLLDVITSTCVVLCSEVLIEKHWRVVTPRSVCDYFWDEACKYSSKEVGHPTHVHPPVHSPLDNPS